ncbi:hypothetical protein [Lysinibacillus fusiformis]|uniref:hypothetical protein n=1 Tax=Lysinibacillus fusiformis TaxID=28031 RepID=UPI003654C6F2
MAEESLEDIIRRLKEDDTEENIIPSFKSSDVISDRENEYNIEFKSETMLHNLMADYKKKK